MISLGSTWDQVEINFPVGSYLTVVDDKLRKDVTRNLKGVYILTIRMELVINC
jgi:hypothetical protein